MTQVPEERGRIRAALPQDLGLWRTGTDAWTRHIHLRWDLWESLHRAGEPFPI